MVHVKQAMSVFDNRRKRLVTERNCLETRKRGFKRFKQLWLLPPSLMRDSKIDSQQSSGKYKLAAAVLLLLFFFIVKTNTDAANDMCAAITTISIFIISQW
ncbi:hypothetical protein TSUD_258960 [Trifolium subterraneum]|uniref:Uncharacterized protein n=1 Tax=Trifolium subterraneum TaxID=3900 RepID=A0A2Z6MWC9_TRISU|nr:hypothetical protein TSUD_258960 [Trifolium subterraneum]